MGLASITAVAALLCSLSPGAAAWAARTELTGALTRDVAQPQFDAGVRAMDAFDDAGARQIFSRLLAQGPPSSIAAKVHLYLGILDFNGLDTDGAREEFQRAVETDPAVEPPMTMSPKARMAFSEARRRVTLELAQPVARAAAAPAVVPNQQAPLAAVEPAPGPARGHTAAYVLGSVALVSVALVVIGVIQVESFESLQGKLKNPVSYTQYEADAATVTSEGPSAQTWEGVAIAAGVVALGAGTGAGFAW